MTLYSQYTSGIQVWAGTITENSTGEQGINPIVDRLNSIASSDNLITGSRINGTNIVLYPGSIVMTSGAIVMEQKGSVPGDILNGRIWIEV